jgi:hypothetical protein
LTEINVILGNEKDFELYLQKVKNHDARTLRIYWGQARSLNRKSSNQWFLTLSRQGLASSIVSILPITVLPMLSKTLPPFRWRKGTVFTPTPAGTALVFGDVVMDADQVGVLHSRDAIAIKGEKVEELKIEPVKKLGRPKGSKNAEPHVSLS